MSRKSYVQIDGVLYDKSEPLPSGVVDPTEPKSTIMISGDLPSFVSPIDGTLVDGRVAMRAHCARHNVVPMADLAGLPPKMANVPYVPDREAIRETLRSLVYKF